MDSRRNHVIGRGIDFFKSLMRFALAIGQADWRRAGETRMRHPGAGRLEARWRAAEGRQFLATAPEAVIGVLAMADLQGALEAEQRLAWEEEMDILRAALAGFEGIVLLEFDVPRLGSIGRRVQLW